MNNAVNGQVTTKNGITDYIRFGSGPRVLVMIPGVGDGLKTVKGTAIPFSLMYRSMTKDFTVYAFSRRRELAQHTDTREMAQDLSDAMDVLGLSHAAVLGVSQGGMIAQWLAADHPDKVDKLVLTVTAPCRNEVIETVITRWMKMAEQGDYKGIMMDTAELSYSPEKLGSARISYKLLGNVGKPKSFDRFMIQAESCLTHDAREVLGTISCPTLVIGGTDDKIVSGKASEDLAEMIPGAQLYMYEGLSHGLYEEAKDFNERVMAFCR